jgi:propanediol dehydratase small subunit
MLPTRNGRLELRQCNSRLARFLDCPTDEYIEALSNASKPYRASRADLDLAIFVVRSSHQQGSAVLALLTSNRKKYNNTKTFIHQ